MSHTLVGRQKTRQDKTRHAMNICSMCVSTRSIQMLHCRLYSTCFTLKLESDIYCMRIQYSVFSVVLFNITVLVLTSQEKRAGESLTAAA